MLKRTSTLELLPNDILVLIIQYLSGGGFMCLIEAFPTLQYNEILWKKALKNKYVMRGSYYTTYITNLKICIYQLWTGNLRNYDIPNLIQHRSKNSFIRRTISEVIMKILITDCQKIKHCDCRNICVLNCHSRANLYSLMDFSYIFEKVIKEPLFKYLIDIGFTRDDFKLWATIKYDDKRCKKLHEILDVFLRSQIGKVSEIVLNHIITLHLKMIYL